jgi:hypothetical protein
LASLDQVPNELIGTLNNGAIFLFHYISDILDNAAYRYEQKARLERYTIIQNPDHPDYIIMSEEQYTQMQTFDDEETMEYIVNDNITNVRCRTPRNGMSDN